MNLIVKRGLVILLIICALAALVLGVSLFMSRPQGKTGAGGFSLNEGPLDMVGLLHQESSLSETGGGPVPIIPQDDDAPKKELGVLLTGDDFSASILTDGRTGVGLDISDDIDWDVSFDVNPWEDIYGFTTEWTVQL